MMMTGAATTGRPARPRWSPAESSGSLRLASHPGDRDDSLLDPLLVIEPAGDLCLYPLVGKQTHHIRRGDKDI